jgi:hypothetical protein
MAGKGQIEPRWSKGESGNPNGRPRKWISELKDSGYKSSEVNDCILVMLSMTLEELADVYKNPKATILEKTVANALKRSLEKGSLYSIETLLSRAVGKPKESVDHTTAGERIGEIQVNIVNADKLNGDTN